MFRKIVTELMYSPALAGSLGDYIKQLRDERSKRQVGLIFVLLAVTVQLFATLSPPESANANNPNVFIDDGIQSTDDFLRYYDQNSRNIRDLLTSLGISRQAVEASKPATIPITAEASAWSMQNTRSQATAAYYFQTGSGAPGVAYYQPFGSPTESPAAFIGSSPNGWFAIEKRTGQLITEHSPPQNCLTSVSANDSGINSTDDAVDCSQTQGLSLSVRQISSNSSTMPDVVHTSDRIVYTLSVTNKSEADIPATPLIGLEDILEYSRIIDNGGGEYNYDTKILSWPTITLASGERTERSFIIQLLPTIPSTARGQYARASYDCTISASFGDFIALPVACPAAKSLEHTTDLLPRVSTKVNLVAAGTLLFVSIFLYARSRQLLSELYSIRHTLLGGV